MQKINSIKMFIAALALLCLVGTGTALANDFSIYGSELGRFLQSTDNRTGSRDVTELANLSIYGDGIDSLMNDTGRATTRTLLAGLDNMSIYGGTMDAYMLSSFCCPSINLDFLNRLVFNP